MGEHGIKWGGKIFLNLDYADDLSILDESVNKMNELLKVLRVQGAKIGLKIRPPLPVQREVLQQLCPVP